MAAWVVLPASVAEAALLHQRTTARLVEIALTLLGSALTRISSPTGWRDAVATIAQQLLALQVAAAALADPFLDQVLHAQGADTAADAHVNAEGFADLTDGAGSWMRLLIFAPNSVDQPAKRLLATSIVANGLQDTARSAVQAGMQARPAVQSYVRMLNPPSCSRCAVLAGRVYQSMTAFARHPRCDCINVPAAESTPDWTTSPALYFRSLTPDQQDTVFGVAGARAIRDGADISQVVNAYSGVTTMQAYGREVQATTVGTTRRALFGGYEVLPDGTLKRRPGRATTTAPRLLPDEIYRLADEFGWDRTEVTRQLRIFGYLI
jgi:hypothetical protein